MVKIVSNFNTNVDKSSVVGYVVSTDGTMLNEIKSGDRIIHPKQNKYKESFQQGENFVKLFPAVFKLLRTELTLKERDVLISLCEFVSYDDCVLRYNNKGLSIKQLAELLDENYANLRKIMSSLEKHDLIAKYKMESDSFKGKTKDYICVNPFIFIHGTRVDINVWNAFSYTK